MLFCTLSQFDKLGYRFMALGDLYGVTSCKLSVTDIIWHTFAQSIVL